MEYIIIGLLFLTTILCFCDARDARRELRDVRRQHDALMNELLASEDKMISCMRYDLECE